jgi:hypothetical protein
MEKELSLENEPEEGADKPLAKMIIEIRDELYKKCFSKEARNKEGFDEKACIKQRKKRFLEEFSNNPEIVELMFGTLDLLDIQAEIKKLKENNELPPPDNELPPPELYQDITEYLYLISHFVNTCEDKKALIQMWLALLRFGEIKGRLNDARNIRNGVLAQVALHKALKKIGLDPKFALPKEDAYFSIDEWAESTKKKIAFQVKRVRELEKPVIINVDEIAFPAYKIKIPQLEEKSIFSVHCDLERFVTKKKIYEKIQQEKFRAYLVILPGEESGAIHGLTGEPKEEVVEALKKELFKN